MKYKSFFLSIICAFALLISYAQYTIEIGGEVKLYAPASRDSKKPDLYDVKWRANGTGSVTLISDTSNPVIVRGISAGEVTVSCSARYYNKSKWTDPMYSGYIYENANYTITVKGDDGESGGGTDGDNPGGGGSSSGDSDDEYFYYNTIEGIPMHFFIWQGSEVSVIEKCISYANGRVTIPSYANGYPVTYVSNAAFWNISGLTELVIPSTVNSVDTYITLGCDNLESIICEATTPPYAMNEIISDKQWSCTLYVPEGSKSKYKEAKGWGNFRNIKTIGKEDEEPTLELSASPSGGVVSSGTKVYLTAKANGNTISGADIYYTTNGNTPTKNSTRYTATGITINEACTLKAKAYKDGYEDSNVLSATYTIKQKDPTSISVSPSAKTIKVGESFTASYTLAPSDATSFVKWSSEDKTIAKVDESTGKVTGIKNGTTLINATTANGITGSCEVTVYSDPISLKNCGDNLTCTYDPNTKTLTISGAGEMYDFEKISQPWFNYNKDILNIVIDSEVTSIGYKAFNDCSSITSINIPDNITSLGKYCFYTCEKLNSITIGKGITTISAGAFANCPSLNSITIPDNITTIDESAFHFCI